MWERSVQFVDRYLAIGVLIGIGMYAVDEIHWPYVGNERVETFHQIPYGLIDPDQMMEHQALSSYTEEGQSEARLSNETASGPDLLRPIPYFVNGRIQGYRVFPGKDRNAFRSLGLKPGDLVTEIDRQPLTDSEVAFELFAKALSGQPVVFSVLRGDELVNIEIKVD